MAQHQPIVVKEAIHNITFTYTARTGNSGGLQVFGHAFDPAPSYNSARSLNYWKAQLAFRGFSAAGQNVDHLKIRLRNAGVNVMDADVAEGGERLQEAFRKKRRIRLRLRSAQADQEAERLAEERRRLEQDEGEESDRVERAETEEEEEEDLTIDDVCFLIADSDEILHRDKIILLLIAQIKPGNYATYDAIAAAYWYRYDDKVKITGRNVGPTLKRNNEIAALLPIHRLVRKNGMGSGPDWGPHVTNSSWNAELLKAEGCRFDSRGMLRSAIKWGGQMTEMEFNMNRNLPDIDMPAMMLADYIEGLFNPQVAPPSRPRPRTRREAISQAREKWEELEAELSERAEAGERTPREWKLLALDHQREFLSTIFFDENGLDKNGPPVLLKGLGPSDRCQLHQQAESLGLYSRTCCNGIMVVGSGRNYLGEQKYAQINRQVALNCYTRHEEELW